MWTANFYDKKIKRVSSNSTDDSSGIVIPNGVRIAITKIRLSGADPNCFSYLVFGYGGENENIIFSTKDSLVDDINIMCELYQITGNGSDNLSIIIENNNDNLSPPVGGSWEATIIG